MRSAFGSNVAPSVYFTHHVVASLVHCIYSEDTAVTRARVNIFIAETNTESSRPMFNYFQRRSVVDVVSKEKSEEEGLSGVRICEYKQYLHSLFVLAHYLMGLRKNSVRTILNKLGLCLFVVQYSSWGHEHGGGLEKQRRVLPSKC